MDYQAKGSGAGIKDFVNKTVDFAASDAAMTDEEIASVDVGVQLLPMTAGKIVLSYNLPNGPEDLKLSREAYSKIFLGQITTWNDPVIAKANPGVTLPATAITVVRRADSSGTTFVFTQHLSGISEAWKNGPGSRHHRQLARAVISLWPPPRMMGWRPRSNRRPGRWATSNTALQNSPSCRWPGWKTRPASSSSRRWKAARPPWQTSRSQADFRAWLPDPDGADSYPIVSYTWMLFYKKYSDPKMAEAIRQVVKYCLTEGQKVSGEMGYIPLPEPSGRDGGQGHEQYSVDGDSTGRLPMKSTLFASESLARHVDFPTTIDA